MKIEYKDIILRDMTEADIEDYVRWFTIEIKWSDTDAPWEPIESDEETERVSWHEYYEYAKELSDDVRRWKFEIEWNGRHIGWVSSYPIDENYEWIDEIGEGQTVYRAVGIDICEPDVWGNGIGAKALAAFINYLLENGENEIAENSWVIEGKHSLMKREAVEASCTLPGTAEYWFCTTCGGCFADESGTQALEYVAHTAHAHSGHTWDFSQGSAVSNNGNTLTAWSTTDKAYASTPISISGDVFSSNKVIY